MSSEYDSRQSHFRSVSDEFEEGDFNIHLPYSDLGRWISDDSVLAQAASAFRIWGRLNEIRALSFLSYVGPEQEKQYFTGYPHHRLDHSLVVGLTAGEIGRHNNLLQQQIDTLEIAGILHDIATPALGDATKSIDPTNLDEEKFWYEVLGKKGKKFLRQQGLRRKTLDEIIKNQGILGQVLDIADRIIYTMKDLHEVIGTVGGKINISPYLIELRYPLSHYPDIGNIYKDVVMDQKRGLVFFSDQKKLGVFLLLRALMHKHLYMEPASQGRDLFVANLIRPLYSPDGSKALSPRQLRQMTDRETLDILAKHYEFPRLQGEWLYSQLTNWYPRHERCETQDEAEEKAKDLSQKFLVMGIKECKGFDAGLSYLTLDENQKVVSFKDADPGMAYQIRGIEKDTKAVYVFYTDISEDTPINELLRKVHGMSKSITVHEQI